MDDAALNLSPMAAIGEPSSPQARAALISAAGDGREASHFVPWRGGLLALPTVRVPSDTPVYRAENGRVIAELQERARVVPGGADASAGQDTREIQQLLHELLLAHASDPTGPVYQELARHGQQTEPLLATREGVLVNGNRRLAAMRELMARDPQRYGAFAVAEVAVLPADATAADIEAIEAALQMAPETKLGYGWTNRRLKLRRQRDELGLSVAAIIDAYRLEDPAQIDRELAELALAEEYLANYADAPGRYSEVRDAEALFVGLNQQLGELAPDLRRLWRLAGFAMISARATMTKPMDREFPFAAPTPAILPAFTLQRFAEERGLVEAQQDGNRRGVLDPQAAKALDEVLAAPEDAGALTRQLIDLMGRLRVELQEETTPRRMLKMLQRARQMMVHLSAEGINEKDRARLRTELSALQLEGAAFLDAQPRPPGED